MMRPRDYAQEGKMRWKRGSGLRALLWLGVLILLLLIAIESGRALLAAVAGLILGIWLTGFGAYHLAAQTRRELREMQERYPDDLEDED